jgi:hypothetical protein
VGAVAGAPCRKQNTPAPLGNQNTMLFVRREDISRFFSALYFLQVKW